MVSDTDGDDQEPGLLGYEYPDPESYWRRRFFILLGGLVLVGGITWALSVMAGPVKPIRVAGTGHGGPHGSLAVGDSLPPAAYGAAAGGASSAGRATAGGSSGGGPAARGASSTGGPSAGATAVAGQATGGTPGSSMAPTPSASPSAGSARACSPSSIVLSLFTSQARYSAGQQPRFEVYAVSTAPGTCGLAYGPSAVHVVVTRKGHVMWDSTACAQAGRAPAAPGLEQFTEGVPRVITISWDRRASRAGCAGAVPAGTAGTFAAVAMADGMTSQVRTFSLSR